MAGEYLNAAEISLEAIEAHQVTRGEGPGDEDEEDDTEGGEEDEEEEPTPPPAAGKE